VGRRPRDPGKNHAGDHDDAADAQCEWRQEGGFR